MTKISGEMEMKTKAKLELLSDHADKFRVIYHDEWNIFDIYDEENPAPILRYSGKPLYLTGNKGEIDRFLGQFDTFLFDCDGVLWSGDNVLPGVPETLEMLRNKGKNLIFVTNNSTKSRADCTRKFLDLGMKVSEREVISSAYSAAVYISKIIKPNKKVFVVGEAGLEKELKLHGIQVVGGSDENFRRTILPNDFTGIADNVTLDGDVEIVLVGLDFNISYLKLAHAVAYIKRGARFIATNLDCTLPRSGKTTANRCEFPGAGSISASIATASMIWPESLGKPSWIMLKALAESDCPGSEMIRSQAGRNRVCMIGDRLDTDICFARRACFGGSLAVLSGIVTKEEIINAESTLAPSVYADSLSDILLA